MYAQHNLGALVQQCHAYALRDAQMRRRAKQAKGNQFPRFSRLGGVASVLNNALGALR
jgi:hypothetical protein